MANSYLFRNFTSAGDRKTFTFSAWVKFSDDTSISTLFATGADSENRLVFIRHNSGSGSTLKVDGKTSTNQTIEVRTNRSFRDINAWYHIVLRVDTTQNTAADRVRIYVNGVQETSFAQSTYPSQDYDTEVNKTANHMVGRYSYSASNYLNGYMSHVAFVDGASLAPTTFGETDPTSGIWEFKAPSGVTWGTNGFHLKFENSSNLGLDSSSNTANWTSQGDLKQALDTPSNVYATMNSISTDQTLTNGNTTAQHSGSGDNYQTSPSTLAMISGKWYCECKVTADSNYPAIGIATTNSIEATKLESDWIGKTSNSYGYYLDGEIYNNGSTVATGQTTFATNDIVGMALDLESAQNTLKFYKNGSLVYTQNIADTPQGWYFACTNQGTRTSARNFFNFGNGFFGTTAIASAGSNGNGSLFEYDVPSGHYALNTKNINTYG